MALDLSIRGGLFLSHSLSLSLSISLSHRPKLRSNGVGYQDPTKRGLPVLLALRAKRGAINLYAVLSRNPANVCLCLRIFDCLNFYLRFTDMVYSTSQGRSGPPVNRVTGNGMTLFRAIHWGHQPTVLASHVTSISEENQISQFTFICTLD